MKLKQMIFTGIALVLVIFNANSNVIKSGRKELQSEIINYSEPILRTKENILKEQIGICNVSFDLNGGEDRNGTFVYNVVVEKVKDNITFMKKKLISQQIKDFILEQLG